MLVTTQYKSSARCTLGTKKKRLNVQRHYRVITVSIFCFSLYSYTGTCRYLGRNLRLHLNDSFFRFISTRRRRSRQFLLACPSSSSHTLTSNTLFIYMCIKRKQELIDVPRPTLCLSSWIFLHYATRCTTYANWKHKQQLIRYLLVCLIK